MEDLVETALDCGIDEGKYWSMTLNEVIRAIESKRRVQKREYQDKAFFDYQLANLIGISVSRVYSNSNRMPDIYKVYPQLFGEEIEEEKQRLVDQKSMINFRNFADAFNRSRKEGVSKEWKN